MNAGWQIGRARVAIFGGSAVALLLGACAGPKVTLPRGEQAYAAFPPRTSDQAREYRIGPLDVLSINVFKEPDLTFKELQVDAGGNLAYPLIGGIRAAGKTAAEVSAELARRLNARFLRDAQVSVTVASSVSQNVTIEGNVVEPGVYDISGGSTTLLQAIARAKSPTRTARLDQVVVFRTVNGERLGGVFNLADIRAGRAADPELRGGDMVVVGFSALKGAFRDFLTAAPLFNVFTRF